MKNDLPRKVDKRIAYIARLYDEDIARRYREAYLVDPTKTDRELLKGCCDERLREENKADIAIMRQRCTT